MLETIRTPRFLIVQQSDPDASKDDIATEVEECYSLINALSGVEIMDVVSMRGFPELETYVGRGKIPLIRKLVEVHQVNVVVVNAVAKSRQMHAIKMKLIKTNPQIEVWDRVDLILYIFSRHASTAESNFQIELARMRHMGARIYGMGMVMSRQGGGIGTSGIGETNTELMKRHWRDAMKKIQVELDTLSEDRKRQLVHRRRAGMQTVSIVGYTNAGKTSLFNLLTGKQKLTKNQLFATLDSAVGKVYLPHERKELMVSDTIGFIKNLPMGLVNAFKSTLLESIHSDVLLHVIDASDPHMAMKIRVVEKILQELELTEKPQIYIFNKIDATYINRDALKNRYADKNPICISVKKEEGIQELLREIEQNLPYSDDKKPIT